MKRCPACQQTVPPDAKFCGYCGFRMGPLPRESSRDSVRAGGQEESSGFAGSGMDSAASAAVGAQPPADARRRCQRFPLKVEVNYGSEHNFFVGFSQNISAGGLFVATYQPARLGDQLEVTFTVPGLQMPCVARCEVKWVREQNPINPDMVPGMGLSFVGLGDEVAQAVGVFIQHREPIFFE